MTSPNTAEPLGDEFVTMTGTTELTWLDPMYHDGTTEAGWFAADSRFPGAWGEGATEEAALDDFCDVLRDWWQLKVSLDHDDLPPAHVVFTAAPSPPGTEPQ